VEGLTPNIKVICPGGAQEIAGSAVSVVVPNKVQKCVSGTIVTAKEAEEEEAMGEQEADEAVITGVTFFINSANGNRPTVVEGHHRLVAAFRKNYPVMYKVDQTPTMAIPNSPADWSGFTILGGAADTRENWGAACLGILPPVKVEAKEAESSLQ